MSKQSLLLVDGDTRSLRVLEVSLRKAGFMVTAATSVQDALGKLELHAPDLIISETTFPDGDGFELRRRVRATAEWSEIPFIFLTAEAAIENKIRGLELGVDDYLTKPIYIKEIVTRINILLQKRQRVRFEERRDGRTRFAGRVQDMPVVDVIQTIEISRKSGVIQFVGERGRQAAIYFRDGRVIDAEAGSLQGEDAVYRLLTWSEGEFEVVFRTVRRREVITMSSQGLLMEGMRRLDEWSRLFEQLPPLTHRFEVDTIELAARLGDVPDDNNRILRLFDGKRTLLEVIDASDVGDLECLQAISRLYFEDLLLDLDHGKAPRRDTGKSMPLVELEGPSPVDDAPSGPTSVGGQAAGDASANPAGDAAAREAEAAQALEAGRDAFGESLAGPGESDGDHDAPERAAGASDGGEEAAPDSDDEPDRHEGPLMGGFRPSSLRLIDEAVAAAQAIEPSLFDDAVKEDGAAVTQSHDGDTSNGVPRTQPRSDEEGDGEDEPASAQPGEDALEVPTEPAATTPLAMLRAAEREESGLRMIGSLGRDRAEASGELAPLGQARPLRSETARELVTILPRRITREMPVVAQELAESLPTPTPTSPMLVPKPVVALAQELPSARSSVPGTGVRAPSRSWRLLRFASSVDGNGPGLGALLLMLLAAVLAGTAVFLRLRRHARPAAHMEAIQDAAQAPGPPDRSDRPAPAVPGTPDLPSPGPAPHGSSAFKPSEQTGDTIDSSAPPPVATRAADRGRPSASEWNDGATAPRATGSATGGAASAANTGPGSARASGAGDGGPAAGAGSALPAAQSAASTSDGPRSLGPRASGAGSASTPAKPPSTGERPQAGAPGPAPGPDKNAEAKVLYDRAQQAMGDSDFAQALELANASLKLRRTARTYLLRAQAEQHLDRVDDALSSVNAAVQIAPELAAVWEMRGRILWAAQRRDEARTAFARFLELEPNSPRAASVQRLMNEPR